MPPISPPMPLTPASSVFTVSSTTSTSATATATRPLPPPPWDRTCDVSFGSFDRDSSVDLEHWKNSVSIIYSLFGRSFALPGNTCPSRLLQLPDGVRLRIYTLLLPSSSRPVRLNPLVFTRPVWPEDAFGTLSSVFTDPLVRGLLRTSFCLRAEVLAAMFCTRRFHAVFSPYVRPVVCPLATSFLARYGSLMQHLTLELDCTRLGYGMHPAAAGLHPGMLSMDTLVGDAVASILCKTQSSMKPSIKLVVLCRRYYGKRPGSAASGEPYVGPEVERVVEQQLCRLGGLVLSARLVGFTADFSARVLSALNSDPSQDTTRHAPSDLYPLLPGHGAYVDYGPELGICLSSNSALAPVVWGGGSGASSGQELSIDSLTATALSRSWMIRVKPKPIRSQPAQTVGQQRPMLALFGIARNNGHASAARDGGSCYFVGARLAAAGLAVGVVGSPLRLGARGSSPPRLFPSLSNLCKSDSVSSSSSTSSSFSTASSSSSTSDSSVSSATIETVETMEAVPGLSLCAQDETDIGEAWRVGLADIEPSVSSAPRSSADSRPRKLQKLQKRQRPPKTR